MTYSASRKRGLKTVPKLAPDQISQTMRVSGPLEVLAWAAALTAKERGGIFMAAYLAAVSTEFEQAHPPAFTRLELGTGRPDEKAAHHGLIVRQLEAGGQLERVGKAWRLTTSEGEARTLNQNMIDVLLRSDVLRPID